jgi:hypothetical protein
MKKCGTVTVYEGLVQRTCTRGNLNDSLIWPVAIRAWGLFALWFIPLAADFFLFYEWNDGPLGGIPPMPSPEQVFQWLAITYIVVSVLVIFSSVWRNRKGTPARAPWSHRKKLLFWSIWGIYIALIVIPRAYAIIYRLIA